MLVSDSLVAALDRDLRAAPFLDIAIHEVRRDIELFRQSDQELGRLLLVLAESSEIRPRKRRIIAQAKLLLVMAGFLSSGELEAFEFDVAGAEVSEVVVGLLSEPGFGATTEDFG